MGIDALTLSIDQVDMLEFTIAGCGPQPPFLPNTPITLTTTADDGSGSALRFKGDIFGPITFSQAATGWQFAYAATGLKKRAEYITLRGSDGGAVAAYNLSPDDPDSLFTLNGMSVGAIVQAVLTAPVNAAALTAAGIGGMTLSGGVYTLPSTTLADLALLTLTPTADVRLQGEAILSILEQFVKEWHSQYCLWIRPDGVIRIASPFAFTPHALVLPNRTDGGTPGLEWPQYTLSTDNCYTQMQIIGKDIRGAILSQKAGTLYPAWTTMNQGIWTITDFVQPKGAADDGSCTVTSTSATVTSAHPTVHWTSGFWPSVGGFIYVHNVLGTGIDVHDALQVTSCTAMAPGGSATITWDSTTPLDSTGYTTYQLVGTNTPLAVVSREFWVCEPHTGPAPGALGLATYVGSHLSPHFGRGGFAWANTSSVLTYTYPAAKVMWSRTGAWPWFEEPVVVTIDPKTGQVLLAQPAVQLGAQMANTTSGLLNGYPGTFAQGLPYDVQVIVPYNRGDLVAYAPLPGAGVGGSNYTGVAYSKYNIQRIKYLPIDSFTFRGDLPAMQALATEKLRTMQDPTVEGSIGLHFDAGALGFDLFTLGYALNLSVTGNAFQLDGINLPVRSLVFRWPNEGADEHNCSFRFSNQLAPFSGDSLYIHPRYSEQTWGTQDGDLFSTGGGFSGAGVDFLSQPNALGEHTDPAAYGIADATAGARREDSEAPGKPATPKGIADAARRQAKANDKQDMDQRSRDRVKGEHTARNKTPRTFEDSGEVWKDGKFVVPDDDAKPRPGGLAEQRGEGGNTEDGGE